MFRIKDVSYVYYWEGARRLACLFTINIHILTRKVKIGKSNMGLGAEPKHVLNIAGPKMVRSQQVIDAIDALLYLPDNFRLIFVGLPQDQVFYNDIVILVERLGMSDRVRFMYDVDDDIDLFVIGEDDTIVDEDLSIAAENPEQIASGVLKLARFTPAVLNA